MYEYILACINKDFYSPTSVYHADKLDNFKEIVLKCYDECVKNHMTRNSVDHVIEILIENYGFVDSIAESVQTVDFDWYCGRESFVPEGYIEMILRR